MNETFDTGTRAGPPVALSVAGSDPTGGAGVQADLKTFEALCVFGTTAITALTVQDPGEVREVVRTENRIIEGQIRAVREEFRPSVVKTGMLVDKEIVGVVASALNDLECPLIVDPVISSTSGATLLDEEGVEALKREILPGASVVTPNVSELEQLVGVKINGVRDAAEGARILCEGGSDATVVTGIVRGKGEIADLLYHGGEIREFRKERAAGKDPHGTGCTFSAAVAAHLARGTDIASAVKKASEFTGRAVRFSAKGRGGDLANPAVNLWNEAERFSLLRSVRECVGRLVDENIRGFIPEVASNFVAALPYALTPEETAGIEGRIVRLKNGIHAHTPWFGVSDHVARFLINIRRFDPSVGCSMNIRYDPEIVELCREMGYEIATSPRKLEPESGKGEERRTMNWAADHVMRGRKRAPDIVVDEGGVGKEPMIRVLASGPETLVEKILRIWRATLRE